LYALGVDLGTVFTAAATWRDGHAEICSLGSRSASIPSVVLLREDASFLTGEAASRRALTEPSRVAREFKRRFGDAAPIMLGGSPYSAEALMGRLLGSVVAEVTAQQGEAPSSLCVCHPANWGPYKTDLLQQAIRMADLGIPVTLAVEPVAAAAYYARQQRVDDGALVAVYDLGGGTFDSAVVRKTGDGFEIIGSPEGIEHLGGSDFDAAVYEHVRSVVGEPLRTLDDSLPTTVAAVARLREECTTAKETLSSDTDTTIPVLLPKHATEVRITRAELERMVRPSLYDTISALQRAIRSAGVTASDLHSVLLIGGSSRMPLVAQLVGAEVDRPVSVDAHPKHAVALGAAWIAETHRTAGAPSPASPAPASPASEPPAPELPAPAAGREPAGRDIPAPVVPLTAAAAGLSAVLGARDADPRPPLGPANGFTPGRPPAAASDSVPGAASPAGPPPAGLPPARPNAGPNAGAVEWSTLGEPDALSGEAARRPTAEPGAGSASWPPPQPFTPRTLPPQSGPLPIPAPPQSGSLPLRPQAGAPPGAAGPRAGATTSAGTASFAGPAVSPSAAAQPPSLPPVPLPAVTPVRQPLPPQSAAFQPSAFPSAPFQPAPLQSGGDAPGGWQGGTRHPFARDPEPAKPSLWSRPWVLALAAAVAVVVVVTPTAYFIGERITGNGSVAASTSSGKGTAPATTGRSATAGTSSKASGAASSSATQPAATSVYTCPTDAEAVVRACLKSAHASGGRLTITYTTNFTVSGVQDAAHNHLHLYLANPGQNGATVPADSTMQDVPNAGTWYIIYDGAITTIDNNTVRGGKKAPLDLAHNSLLCVRVATGLHNLTSDRKGGIHTGNCVKITT
jgi:molecular chaperone DnaK